MEAAILKPWDKLDGETGAAYSAFCVYRDMGTSRNLSAAYKLHLDSKGESGEVSPERAQTEPSAVPSETDSAKGLVASGRWKQWSKKFSWRERAEAYDRHLAAIRLAEQEKRAQSFSATYAEKQEEFLLALLRIKVHLAKGAEEMLAKGKLIEKVIRRVGRDSNGEPVQQEEKFSMAEQLEKLFELDKFLRGELKGEAAAADSSEAGDDSWVTDRLRQISAGSSTDPSQANPDSTPPSEPSTKGSLVQ